MVGLITYHEYTEDTSPRDAWEDVMYITTKMAEASGQGKMGVSHVSGDTLNTFYDEHSVQKSNSSSIDDIDDEFGQNAHFPEFIQAVFYEGTPIDDVYKAIIGNIVSVVWK